jgi:hypothetical protein
MSEYLRFLSAFHGPVRALAAWRATTDEREQALSAYQTRGIVADLDRSGESATLVRLLELATGLNGYGPGPPQRQDLLSRINSALDRGALLVIPGWTPTHATASPLTGHAQITSTETAPAAARAFRTAASTRRPSARTARCARPMPTALQETHVISDVVSATAG